VAVLLMRAANGDSRAFLGLLIHMAPLLRRLSRGDADRLAALEEALWVAIEVRPPTRAT